MQHIHPIYPQTKLTFAFYLSTVGNVYSYNLHDYPIKYRESLKLKDISKI